MKRTRNAFTLIEMLIVIAIISILAAMAISSFSNAAQDSREVLVRQQLATVQEAVNNWASRQIGKVATNGANPITIEQVRTTYNNATFATTPSRWDLFKGYLDARMHDTSDASNPPIVTVYAATSRLTTDAMRQTGYYLTLPNWGTGSYPKVQINP